MSDINTALSKYFDGEATPEEEVLVQQFKLEQPKEYDTLKAFWEKKNIAFSSFDTEKGWQKVLQKSKPPKRISKYVYLRRVASVAAVFLLAIAGIYYSLAPVHKMEIVEIQATQKGQRVQLDDGSVLYLNDQAVLSYPKKFDSNIREVSLKGEAFFEIQKDPSKPFVINTHHSTVEVLGTSFNINTNLDQTSVSVATGKVKVEHLNSDEFAILTPNQSVKATKLSMHEVENFNKNYLSWKTGVFHFEKTTVGQVIKELNAYYEDEIILSESDSDCLLSSTFNQQSLDEIIEIIQISCGLKLKQKDNYYELYN